MRSPSLLHLLANYRDAMFAIADAGFVAAERSRELSAARIAAGDALDAWIDCHRHSERRRARRIVRAAQRRYDGLARERFHARIKVLV